MVTAVTYDCWNTLLVAYDDASARRLRAERVAALLAEPVESVAVELAEEWAQHSAAWEAGRCYVARHIVAAMLSRRDVADPTLEQALVRACEEASLAVGVQAVDGAVATLESLRANGVRTALICDTGWSPGRVIRTLLDSVGLLRLLDTLTFSDEVGVPKPAAAMFRHALDGVAAAPHQAMHVGDLRRTDVAGARAAGMRSVRFSGAFDDTSGHPEADHVLSHHAGVIELL